MCLLLYKSWWFAAFALAAMASLIHLVRMVLRRGLGGTDLSPDKRGRRRDPKWVSREIERVCSGRDPNEPLIKQMSAEERAMFEVAVIDALNNQSREGQQRLRSALIKHGYDEQCARRVMSADLADRVRATALLTLLRPQWRDEPLGPGEISSDEVLLRAVAASQKTCPDID